MKHWEKCCSSTLKFSIWKQLSETSIMVTNTYSRAPKPRLNPGSVTLGEVLCLSFLNHKMEIIISTSQRYCKDWKSRSINSEQRAPGCLSRVSIQLLGSGHDLFMSLSPVQGSVLTAHGLFGILCLSLSLSQK